MAVLTGELKTFARKPDVERVAVSLNEAVAHARLIYDARIRDEGVQLDVHIAPGTAVSAESSQLQQVIVNLLGNALDAVHDAPVRRIVIEAAGPDEAGRVRFTVADSGAGIAPEVLPHLFEPFVTTAARQPQLGLAITSRIVEAFGARIAATNRDDGGAQFSIEFAAATLQDRAWKMRFGCWSSRTMKTSGSASSRRWRLPASQWTHSRRPPTRCITSRPARRS